MQTLLAGALLPHLPLQLPQPPRPVWQEKELLPAEAQGAAENKFVPALSFDLALMLGNIPVTCAYSLFSGRPATVGVLPEAVSQQIPLGEQPQRGLSR